MEVNGKLHAPAALPPGKQVMFLVDYFYYELLVPYYFG
jgi:hypothetical protein